MKRTHEGAKAHEHSLDHAVEFFSKAGSLYTSSGTFYGEEESALSLFQKVWIVEPLTAMKLLFWLRDCRGGAGNRSGFRACVNWLADHDPEWVNENIHFIPVHGRFDDLNSLYDTTLERVAASFWASAISEKNVLAAKWADRSDKHLQKVMEVNEADLRKILTSLRADHIVEAKMCARLWKEIEYKKVPSVAMSRYAKAFARNDEERFSAFKVKVEKGEEKVHAGALFPHDCVRTALNGDTKMADLQFEALPNFMEGTGENPLVLCDTSGSMEADVSKNSSVQRIHVSMGLALYCSAKMPVASPFYKKFIGFKNESKFVDWSKLSFSQTLENKKIFDGAIGSTQIDVALNTILKMALFFNTPQELMPTMLIIVSDMQFHPPAGDSSFNVGANPKSDAHVPELMKAWEKAGYRSPKIVYWNVAGYAGSPATVKTPNTGLVSGFSPSILKAVLSGEDFSPRAIMLRALEKYEVVVPKK